MSHIYFISLFVLALLISLVSTLFAVLWVLGEGFGIGLATYQAANLGWMAIFGMIISGCMWLGISA